VDSSDGDSLVAELRDEFERPAESFYVTPQSCDLTIPKIRARLESRDVGLIDLRMLGDVDLRFSRSVSQGA